MFYGQREICVLKLSDVLLLTISCSKLFQSMVVLGRCITGFRYLVAFFTNAVVFVSLSSDDTLILTVPKFNRESEGHSSFSYFVLNHGTLSLQKDTFRSKLKSYLSTVHFTD